LPGKFINKGGEVPARLLRYISSIPAQGLEHVVDRAFPVKVLPQVDAGRAQTKGTTGIGIEENGPIVKRLPEHDEGVGYGSLTVYHGSTVPFFDS
jgi:hypothetical protein